MEAVKEKSTKKLPNSYKVVANIIPFGSDKAIILDDIMKFANVTDKRSAYIIIEELIVKHGYPIAASKKGVKGYFYPVNQRELDQAANTLRNAYESLKKRHDALKKNYTEYQNSK